jgi:hypothetical protein
VELKYGNALVPGWLDRWHDAWVEAHKLVGGDR